MRRTAALLALLAALPALGGCIAYSVASTAVDVTTGVVGTAVDVTTGAVDAVIPGGEDDEDKKDD
jgi:hypothetical protein